MLQDLRTPIDMYVSSPFTSSKTLPSFLLLVSLATSGCAQNRTTEQGEAQITDPFQECIPYSYEPVNAAINNFPGIWETATILANDTAAAAKYQSIIGQIPDIQPKGTEPASSTGDFNGYNYPSSDPDCWWTDTGCTTPKHAGLAADIVSLPEPDSLGYGFDDGPNCSHNVFYDYLAQKNQKATFYYIGSNVMDFPLEAQRALADGHEICVHTWSHPYMTSLQNEQVFAEFWYGEMQAIKLVVGVTPTCWRPPFGDVDDRVRAFAQALGLRAILWQYDSNDWSEGSDGVTSAQIDANYQNLINLADNGTFSSAGTIMLTHELNNFTMSEAMKFHDQLQTAFKYLVPVGVAYNQTQPYVETNYSLPTFEQYISGVTTVSGASNGTAQSNSTTSSASPSSTGQSSIGSGSSSSGSGSSSSGSRAVNSPNGARTALLGIGMLSATARWLFL
ncbi:carbohydrate esterase family 4 protein [Leucogyrophana mollusca]|uniref:Carbohydrate esterase family 4 protein n=1 Tax=Leucogyrophana mollusca TaxID=85980 RepID=A0ACB8BFQ5_9AGAM|nr:carbohydrate esterase family 4 protein [Leucogyrophana mollusca]